MIGRRSLLLAGVSLPAASAAFAQCVTDALTVDACLGGVRLTGPSMPPGATLNLNFMTGTLDPLITFTRASTGTYFDSTGTMQTAAINAPRWDYDPVSLQLRGLLLEDQRTNLALQSANASTWTLSGATVVGSSVVAPDGTMTGASLREDTTNAPHLAFASATIVSATQYTCSFYIKAGTRAFAGISGGGMIGAGLIGSFNLATGTDVSTGVNANFFHGIVPAGNGWFRCWITWTTTNGQPFSVELNSAAGVRSYTGDGVSGAYVWGAQVEVGGFRTSHIPTTTAAVTRSIDSCLIPPANMSPWFAPPGGSWFAEFNFLASAPSNSRVIGRPDTAGGVSPLLLTATRTGSQNDGVSVATANAGAVNAVAKGASTWAAGQAKVCLNGGAVASSAALATGYGAYTASGVRFLSVGAALSGDNTSGWLRRVIYWPRVLTDAEMQQVTT